MTYSTAQPAPVSSPTTAPARRRGRRLLAATLFASALGLVPNAFGPTSDARPLTDYTG